LSYANVVSTLALFIALGGAGAFAANQLPKKSVGARQLRQGAVTASKIRKNAVTAPKIKARAVKQGKIANGAVSGAKLANGAVTGDKLTPGTVTTEKIAPEAVTGAQVNESSLGQVPSAAFASSAGSAESANPALFARVNAEGKVDAGFSKGIFEGNVTTGASGIYCVSVPGFNPRGAQVTAESNGVGNITAYAKVGGTSCPAPKVEVNTYAGGSLEKEPFYLVLYR
jgi:hypothetical protein